MIVSYLSAMNDSCFAPEKNEAMFLQRNFFHFNLPL